MALEDKQHKHLTALELRHRLDLVLLLLHRRVLVNRTIPVLEDTLQQIIPLVVLLPRLHHRLEEGLGGIKITQIPVVVAVMGAVEGMLRRNSHANFIPKETADSEIIVDFHTNLEVVKASNRTTTFTANKQVHKPI